jgi:menaquinol-cytochrome c reductase iron-sulfur subunit
MDKTSLPELPESKGSWDEKELTRRRFLESVVTGTSSVAGLVVAGVGLRFLAGNAYEPGVSKWVQVGNVSELAANPVSRVNYTVRAKDAWRDADRQGTLYVFTVEDGVSFNVLSAICTHLGCIVQWQDAEQQFACPCHSAAFDRNGQVLSGPPPKPLVQLLTKIEDGVLWAEI